MHPDFCEDTVPLGTQVGRRVPELNFSTEIWMHILESHEHQISKYKVCAIPHEFICLWLWFGLLLMS